MDGLQPWASQELQRRGVQDISTALTIAETLMDYKRGESSNFKPKPNYANGGGAMFNKPHQNKEYKKPPFHKDRKKDSKVEIKPRGNCFLCDRPHWARECPKRKSLNAMLEERETQEQPQLGGLQLLSALKASPAPAHSTKDKSLMYVAARINGKDAQVMVDTGASHNFIKREEAMRLGLKLEKGQGWLKTVNAEAKPLDGLARNVELQLGTWRGKVNFSIVPMDDFNIVLGMEFLRQFNVVPLPRYNTVCILEGGPCMIPMVGKPSTTKHLSALQLEEGIEKGEDVHPATLCKGKEEATSKEQPKRKSQVLKKFKNVMLPELPTKCPPKKEVRRAIELEPCAKPTERAPHRTSPPGAKRRHGEKKVGNPQMHYGNTKITSKGFNKKGRRGRRRNRWGRMSRAWHFVEHLVGDLSLAFHRTLGEHSPHLGKNQEFSRSLWRDPEFSRMV